jgi:hypothetical protein
MAYRTLAEVAGETQSELLAGLVPYFTQHNELLTWLDSVIIDRPSVTVNNIVSLGAAAALACDTTITTTAISAAPTEFKLKQFYKAFDVCGTVNSAMGNVAFVDEVTENLAAAAQALGDLIATQIISGDGTGTNILGLNSITTATTAAAATFGLSDLDVLIDLVEKKSNKMAFVANKATRRAIKRELNAEGDKSRIELANNMFVVGYEGIPILTHSSVADGEVYLVNGDPMTGNYMIFGERPGEELSPFRLVDVGWSQTADLRQWRLIVQAAIVNKSTQAVAKLTGVD